MIITPLTSLTALQFSGEKAATLLQGQLTCDMQTITQHGNYSLAACCDHRGRMLANFWVVKWQNDFLLVLPKSVSALLKNHLQKFALLSKVTISNNDAFFMAEISDSPLKKTEEDTILISLPTHNRYLVLAEKNPYPAHTINTDETVWQQHNIENQFCLLSAATSLLFTPQMIGLEKLGGVSFKKGCYVGQEIVARTEYLGKLKKHLHRLQQYSDHPLMPGDELKNKEGDVIGIITEVISLGDNHYDMLAVIQDNV